MEQVKSKHRVTKHGEVFTSEREVNAMLDLVKQETERIDSRFLEPACGEGNFLIAILQRKLQIAKKNAALPPRKKSILATEYEKQAVIAISSLYGVDLLLDNVIVCRQKLLDLWENNFKINCKKSVSNECLDAVKYIISLNIVCGNALSMKKVDDNCNDTEEPIIFSKWSFIKDSIIQRKDYRFDKILTGDYSPKNNYNQIEKNKNIEKSPTENQFDSKNSITNHQVELVNEYISDYRRIQYNGKSL